MARSFIQSFDLPSLRLVWTQVKFLYVFQKYRMEFEPIGTIKKTDSESFRTNPKNVLCFVLGKSVKSQLDSIRFNWVQPKASIGMNPRSF